MSLSDRAGRWKRRFRAPRWSRGESEPLVDLSNLGGTDVFTVSRHGR